jgi:formylglycine-generating enzyme required for sulfatase activity
LKRLLTSLEQLAGLEPRVRAQLGATRELLRLAAAAGAGSGDAARAGVRGSPRYGGLELEPLVALLPLGPNAHSGLWEFLVAGSGDPPASAGAKPTEASGIVLVLLPGGRTRMGRDGSEELLFGNARPAHELELAPFLIATHELTVAQAERLGGYPADLRRPRDGRLPLTIDWIRASAQLRAHGLDLPTEAQWEYAAHLGRLGASGASLEGHANVSDRSRVDVLRTVGTPEAHAAADFDDGFADMAPVASFLPDAAGLFDILGNAAEWCRDPFVVRG